MQWQLLKNQNHFYLIKVDLLHAFKSYLMKHLQENQGLLFSNIGIDRYTKIYNIYQII